MPIRKGQNPIRKKVKAAGLAGAVATIIFAILRNNGVNVDTEVFGLFSISDAVTAASAFVAGYLRSDDPELHFTEEA